MVQIAFLHGVGGAKPSTDWINPLNARLTSMHVPTLVDPPDDIVVPSYGDLFTSTAAAEPPDTYRKYNAKEALQHRLEFWTRQKQLEREVRPHAESTEIFGLHNVPDFVLHPLADLTEFLRFEEVTTYLEQRAVRNATYRRVLAQIPKSGHVILIAHSLGSVVAAGLLRRLPPELTIDLFITIGSPLGIPRYRSHLDKLASAFPYQQVQRWLNIHGLRDLITGGRGVSIDVPAAIDVAIQSNSHSVGSYMSHPALAAAIRTVVFPHELTKSDIRPPGGGRSPARPTHQAWYPLLLSTAFTWQVANALPAGDWEKYLRLDSARSEVARRAVADIADQRMKRVQMIDTMRVNGVTIEASKMQDHPLADNRYPTFWDLTVGAASILRGAWNDEDLLPFAVGLMMQPLVDPFDIRADLKQRSAALVLTLNLVRDYRGNLADQTYADQVLASVEWGQRELSDSKFPWGTVLIATGVVVLAATGVGLAVAAPAGLAGAAVVTSTLAAFGPGGMVGGLLTLGAVTGSASALGALGISVELDAGDANTALIASVAARTAADLAPLSPESLTVTLSGMLAVIHAQAKLSGFRSTEPYVRAVLIGALDTVRSEYLIHEQIAPSSDGTKSWRRKQGLLERAVTVLNTLTMIPDVEVRITALKALETGRLPSGLSQPPAIIK